MGLMEQIKNDVAFITTNGSDFAIPLIFTDLSGTDFPVMGTARKIHFAFTDEGVAVNDKTASCSASEQVLVSAGYVVRNAAKEVAMANHKVRWTDSSGTLWQYFIRETFPDETLGLIVFILSDFE
jgi:hypothetical protein